MLCLWILFLFLACSVIYSYISFLMRLIEIIKTFIVDFAVSSASSLWRCYNETSRGLHTATLAVTSSSSCIMKCAEDEDQ